MPLDPQGGGSWVGGSEDGRAACLLNGARETHESRPPYARSRGLILRDSFEWKDPREFAEKIPLQAIGKEKLDIEPFTLVLCSAGDPPKLTVLRWDGDERDIEEYGLHSPMIFNAAKLYSKRVIQQSVARFDRFLQQLAALPTRSDLERFNRSENYPDKLQKAGEEAIEGLDTLSTTTVSLQPSNVRLEYCDHKERLWSVVENQ